MMAGMAGVALMIMLGASYDLFNKKIDDTEELKIEDFGRSIQEEIILASEVHEGYERTIELPENVNEIKYNVSLTGNYLIVSYKDGDIAYPLPEVSGSISKGTVTIQNIDGNVQIS